MTERFGLNVSDRIGTYDDGLNGRLETPEPTKCPCGRPLHCKHLVTRPTGWGAGVCDACSRIVESK